MSRLPGAPPQEMLSSNTAPRIPEWRDQGADGLAVEVQGVVKFYDAGKGFGFVVPDDGGREVFVHVSVLTRSGLDELQAGQRVSVWAEEHPRGLQATGVELI